MQGVLRFKKVVFILLLDSCDTLAITKYGSFCVSRVSGIMGPVMYCCVVTTLL